MAQHLVLAFLLLFVPAVSGWYLVGPSIPEAENQAPFEALSEGPDVAPKVPFPYVNWANLTESIVATDFLNEPTFSIDGQPVSEPADDMEGLDANVEPAVTPSEEPSMFMKSGKVRREGHDF